MKRIKEHEESLNVVRAKCTRKDSDFTADELRHLNLVNIELQKSYGKKYVKALDQSCGYCVITAMRCIHNYIVNEEPKTEKVVISSGEIEVEQATIIPVTHMEIDGDIVPLPDGDFMDIIESASQTITEEDENLSLPELRTKYPEIKARSKQDFLNKLK